MAYQWATWLADVLRDAGCPVVEESGWSTRGRPGGTFKPLGIMLHHDASPAGETSGGADVIIDGRPDLEGPLAQLWLSYDGVWHVCAAGRANHAGGGSWHDIPTDDANSYTLGIETDHTTNEQWTDAQFDSGTRGLVALCDRLGIRGDAATLKDWLLAHKEWAPSRKVDPDPLNMNDLRALVLSGKTTAKGILGMSTLTKFSYGKSQKFTGRGDFLTVTIGPDGALSLLTGPAAAYIVTAGVTLERTDEANSVDTGDVVQLRFQTVIDYPDSRATTVESKYPVHEAVINAGGTFANLEWANNLGKSPDPDGKHRLRLFVMPGEGKSVAVTSVTARVLADT